MISYAWRSETLTVQHPHLGVAERSVEPIRETLSSSLLDDAVTRAVDTLGQDDFGTAFLALLNRFAPTDSFAAYQVSDERIERRLCPFSFEGPVTDEEILRAAAIPCAVGGCVVNVPSKAAESCYIIGLPTPDRGILLVTSYRRLDPMRRAEASRLVAAAPLLVTISAKHFALTTETESPSRTPSLTIVSSLLACHAPSLSTREIEVCAELLMGLTTKDVARRSGLGVSTIVTYKKRAFQKLGITTRRDLLLLYHRLAPPEGRHASL